VPVVNLLLGFWKNAEPQKKTTNKEVHSEVTEKNSANKEFSDKVEHIVGETPAYNPNQNQHPIKKKTFQKIHPPPPAACGPRPERRGRVWVRGFFVGE
tara:strand:- start:648 stop:941 length:294 start_codon:yes stop_codon:yes gene_type:complete